MLLAVVIFWPAAAPTRLIASKGCPQVPNSRAARLCNKRGTAQQHSLPTGIGLIAYALPCSQGQPCRRGQPCSSGAASRHHDHPRDTTTMAADPAFFHRDGSGKFHAYDAATNALLEEAYRTQKTCRLPVRGMHLEVRFGAKATSDRVAVPPLSRIVQVNCGAKTRRRASCCGSRPARTPPPSTCALGAAADTSEKKLRHRYARLVALDGSAEADVHILRREGAAHRCRFADGAEHVLSLRCRERAEDPHARPFRVLAEPPPWVLDQAAERAAARRGAERDVLEMTVFAAARAIGDAEKDAAVSIKLKASVALPGFETKHSAKAVAAYPGVTCAFVDAATCVPPELSFRAPSGASLVITAFHKGGGLLGRATARGTC